MSRLLQLGMLDIRDRLPRGTRPQHTGVRPASSGTIHYNGPPVALANNPRATREQWIAHFRGIAQYHVGKVWGKDRLGRPLYGDGIMYHVAALPDGTLVQLRDWEAELWHCANAAGNAASIALHFAVGGAQDVTEAQWAAGAAFFDALIADCGWPGRSVIYGHREWRRLDGVTQSSCPGPVLFRRLQVWRGELRQTSSYRVKVDAARVRNGSGTQYHILETLRRGATFPVDAIVNGQAVSGDRQWAHRQTGGYVHMSLLEAA
jgi:hypothetical protein